VQRLEELSRHAPAGSGADAARSLTPYDRLVAAGKVREPREDQPVDLRSIRRVTATVSSAEIIADVRGDR
jgi:hypothetical protein